LPKRLGFSLLELLIVLSIIALTLTLSLPTFSTFLNQAKSQRIKEQLLRAIHLARSEAQWRGVAVSLCHSANHKICGGRWEDDQIIFIDEAEAGSVQKTEDILSIFSMPRLPGVLHWRSALSRAYLQILPTGLTRGEDGTFWYCSRESKIPVWAIKVSQSGRARVIEESEELQSLQCVTAD
jgi:type IV fimbrial biogenesis protein FimT